MDNKYINEAARVERQAEEVLLLKQKVADLKDRKLSIQEAIKEIDNGVEKEHWVTPGAFFMKMSSEKALDVLKNDLGNIIKEVNEANEALQKSITQLKKLKSALNPI